MYIFLNSVFETQIFGWAEFLMEMLGWLRCHAEQQEREKWSKSEVRLLLPDETDDAMGIMIARILPERQVVREYHYNAEGLRHLRDDLGRMAVREVSLT